MKRYGKCVNKKPYTHKGRALAYIKKQYMKSGVHLRYYECPTCLDFHITSKPPFGPMQTYYKLWDDEKINPPPKVKIKKQNYQKIRKESRKVVSAEWMEFARLFKKKCKKNGVEVRPKKPPTILKGTLPLAEQRRLIAEMHHKETKPVSMWRTIYLELLKAII